MMLAVDFVSGAFAGRFDVGVIMSTDTDLYPALEAVRAYGIDIAWPFTFPPELNLEDDSMDDYFVAAELVDSATRALCEVAAWRAPHGTSSCLRLPGAAKDLRGPLSRRSAARLGMTRRVRRASSRQPLRRDRSDKED